MEKDYICVIGSLNYDIIMKQKRMPAVGETYTADSISYSGGGKGANQCVQCAKLGLPSLMVGKVGSDSFGDVLLGGLRSYGVDCIHVGRSKKPTGVGVVHALEDGSVYASIIEGANFDISRQEIEELDQIIKNSRMIILQLEIPVEIVEYVIERAALYGVYTILNAAPAKEISKKALKNVNCFIVNETEASFYAGVNLTGVQDVKKHKEIIRTLCKGTAVITLGSKGSVLIEEDSVTVIDPVPVENAIETTGAGDSYIGAFAYGKYKGMTDQDACRFAARAAAVTVTRIGAQEAMPVLEEIAG